MKLQQANELVRKRYDVWLKTFLLAACNHSIQFSKYSSNIHLVTYISRPGEKELRKLDTIEWVFSGLLADGGAIKVPTP